MVIVVVRDDDDVDDGDLVDFARQFGEAFGPEPADGRATVCQDGIEQDAQAARELDEIAGMA